jgi:hypothetical protein
LPCAFSTFSDNCDCLQIGCQSRACRRVNDARCAICTFSVFCSVVNCVAAGQRRDLAHRRLNIQRELRRGSVPFNASARADCASGSHRSAPATRSRFSLPGVVLRVERLLDLRRERRRTPTRLRPAASAACRPPSASALDLREDLVVLLRQPVELALVRGVADRLQRVLDGALRVGEPLALLLRLRELLLGVGERLPVRLSCRARCDASSCACSRSSPPDPARDLRERRLGCAPPTARPR